MSNKPCPTKKLGEVCEFIFGYSFRADDFNKNGKGLPVIRIGDIDKGITEKFYDGDYDKKYLVKKGDILIGLSGSIKVNKWKGEKALLNQRIVKIHNFKPEVLGDFIFYQLSSILKRLEAQIAQGTVKNVLLSHLSNLKVLIPPLPIQQKIVERLDAIKKAQELNDKQIALAEELFQSLLNKELKLKKKIFKLIRIKDIIEKIEYGLSVSVVSRRNERGIPILTMAEIEDDGTINYSKLRKIELSTQEFAKFNLNRGDVLFNWRNASEKLLGKTAIFDSNEKAVFASFLLRVIPDRKMLNNYYLFYYLNYLRKIGFFKDRAKCSANNTINASELKQIKIPLPPLETQKKIVEKLSAVQEYKKKLLKQKQLLQELFESVLNKSMKGRI